MTMERIELRGTTLAGLYEVGGPIGIGGTGVVFEATRRTDGASLVIKTLRPKFALNADLCTRLRREAEVARTVFHPGIVPVFDQGVLSDGSPFIVLERIHGESLSRLLRRVGPLPVSEVAVIAMRVAAILHSVHQAGYVHRDIKPEHILFRRSERGSLEVSLLDFGVCASDHAPTEEKAREKGRVYGTPTYVSPEQASGNPYVDGAADLYGLGVTLYEALSGRVPFRASDVTNLLRRIIREDAPPVCMLAPQADGPMDEVVAKLLHRNPARRFPSARSLTRALRPLVIDRVAAERRIVGMLNIAATASQGVETVNESVAA